MAQIYVVMIADEVETIVASRPAMCRHVADLKKAGWDLVTVQLFSNWADAGKFADWADADNKGRN